MGMSTRLRPPVGPPGPWGPGMGKPLLSWAEKIIYLGMSIWKKVRPKPTPHESLLRGIPLFADLTRAELLAVEEILHERSYLAGEIVFEEGDEGLGMYLVVSGRVEILRSGAGGRGRLAEVGPGEFFGELALLDDAPRSASARAMESTRLLGFFQPDVMKTRGCLAAKINYHLAALLAARLRQANEGRQFPAQE